MIGYLRRGVKMRKVFAVLFAVMGLLVFCACGKNEKEEIKKAYAKLHNVHASDVSCKSYGEFDGTYVLIISVKDMDATTALNDVTVDGVDFHFHIGITFDVYRKGAFYTLQEAFDSGLLTHEDLLTVRRNHRAEYEYLYEEFDKPDIKDKTTIFLDEAIEREIIAAVIAAHSDYKYPLHEEYFSLRCFGAFDGVYVLFVDCTQWGYTADVTQIIVDGVEFVYGSGQRLEVYKDGEFYSLTEAFENGILSHDDLLTVQSNYNRRH